MKTSENPEYDPARAPSKGKVTWLVSYETVSGIVNRHRCDFK